MKKAGIVALIGRPNAGKSTLLNTILKRKVTITSPRPHTTIFPIEAVYEDERGQIIFIDTPGLTSDILKEKVNLIVYLVDHTRQRGTEENKTLGLVRKFQQIPKLLVYTKIDRDKKSYKAQYRFVEDEVDKTLEVSALFEKHIKTLLDTIFTYLPEQEPLVDTKDMVTPLLNIDSRVFIAELIREKVYLSTGEEVPYKVRVETDEVEEKNNNMLYIKARILVPNDHYKRMLIGKQGRKIKQLGVKARKELELATNSHIYLDLSVEIKKH